jgi:outer membrane protein
MRFRAWIVCSVAFVSMVIPVFAQTTGDPLSLTIEDSIAAAMDNQPLIKQALAAVRAGKSRVGEAKSSYYPSLSGQGSYTRLEPEQNITIPGPPPVSFSLHPVNNWDFHLALSQVVFAFGREIHVRLAENGVDLARIGVEQIELSIAYQTALTFYGVLFLRDQVQSLDDQLADLKHHLSVIREKEQTGSATKYDVLSTQVQVATLQSQRIDVENQFQKQEIALKELVGVDPMSSVTLAGSFTPAPPSGDIQSYVTQALSRRPEIRQALLKEESAALNRSAARATGLPTVAAHAAAGYKNGLLPDSDSLSFNWNAGVTVNVPLFSGFATAKQIEQMQAMIESAEDNTSQMRRRITTQVLQAYQDVKASREGEKTASVQLDQAQQALDAAKIQYDLGVITNDEYLTSQTALARAKLSHLLALYNEVKSDYALRQAMGEEIWP